MNDRSSDGKSQSIGWARWIDILRSTWVTITFIVKISELNESVQELLANLDIVTGPDRPCHGGLWWVSLHIASWFIWGITSFKFFWWKCFALSELPSDGILVIRKLKPARDMLVTWVCLGGDRVALLAFHLAMIERPMRPVVVSAVALAVYYGSNLHRALANGRKLCAMSDSETTSISDELEYVKFFPVDSVS